MTQEVPLKRWRSFDKCPNCGSSKRLSKIVVNDEEKKRGMSVTSNPPPIMPPIRGVIGLKGGTAETLGFGEEPEFVVHECFCTECGTRYALEIYRGYATVRDNKILQSALERTEPTIYRENKS